MKWSLILLLFIGFIKKTIAPCIVHTSASNCVTHNLTSNVALFGTSYCACLTCSAGKVLDQVTLACCSSASTTGCASCLGSATAACVVCQNGYFLIGTTCSPCNTPIPNCATCSSSTACTACVNISYAISGGICDSCSNLIPNCTTCSSSTTCTTCIASFTVSSGSCTQCNIALNGCNLCSSISVCTNCTSGYTLSGSSCLSCTTIPNCATCSSSVNCTSCSDPTLGAMGGTCLPCSTLLQNCTTCISNTMCTGCLNSSYALRYGQCNLCYYVLGWCIDCASNTTCNTCSLNAYMRPNFTCMSCGFRVSYCVRCYYNATPFQEMICTQCDAYHILDNATRHCYTCQSLMTACLVCYSSPNRCYACLNDTLAVKTSTNPYQCQACSVTLTYCVRCLNIYQCIECIPDPNVYLKIQNTYVNATYIWYGYYMVNPYVGVSGVCRLCNLTFQHCTLCNDTHCLTCVPNNTITLINVGNFTICGFCISVLVGCQRCISQTDCFQCQNSMFHLITISPGVRVCKFCCDLIYGCLICSSPTTCLICSIGTIVNGSCSNVAGCAVVAQTGSGVSRCLNCSAPEFFPDVYLQSCICQKGHIAGSYCTEMIGCTAIHRTPSEDVCTSCDATLNFQNVNDQCQCLPNFELVNDRCEDVCGDGVIVDQQCDDGNQQSLDGCSSQCHVEDKYECLGGSRTTPSICKLIAKISLTVVETRKEPTKNRLTVLISIYPPTKLIELINFTTHFHYTPTDLLKLVQIDVTHNFITISFDYFQDLPQILASMWIDLNSTHFAQPRVKTSYLLQTSSGEPLYFDPWAGSDYSNIKSAVIYLSLSAVIVSVASTFAYKMIGVETLHTFQLLFFGMVFSRRYSNYFNNFDELLYTVGQSSSLISESKIFVPYRLAFMKYSETFEGNLIIIASLLGFAYLLWIIITTLKKIWEKRINSLSRGNLRKLENEKDSMGAIRLVFSDYILLPTALGFYYHFAISFVCQAYLNRLTEYSIHLTYMKAFIKLIASSIAFYILFEQVKKAIIILPTQKIRGNYRNVVYQKPLLPHQPIRKYTSVYVGITFAQGLLILIYLFLNLHYYVEINFVISIIKLAALFKTKPYQMPIHNWALYYNTLVLILGFTWFVLEDFYLLSPAATKVCAISLLGLLGGVLAMAGVRTFYNFWFKFKGKTLNVPSVDENNDQSKENNSKEEKLLGQKKGKFGKENRRREFIETDKNREKNKQLEALVQQYKLSFSKQTKISSIISSSMKKLRQY